MSPTTVSETTSVSSNLSTPQSFNIISLPEDLPMGDTTPKPKQTASQVDAGSMLPPPVPATAIFAATPLRTTRLPSLKELSNRLHASPIATPSSKHIPDFQKPITPPKLHLCMNETSTSSPFLQSPSSRLKLPPSAMKRNLSATPADANIFNPTGLSGTPSNVRSTSPAASEGPSIVSDTFTNVDPFAIDNPNAPGMSKAASKDGYIQGYKDVPSLAVIREKIGSNRPIMEKEIPKAVHGSPLEDSADGRKKEHPLRHAWTLFYDSKNYKPDPGLATPREGEPFLGDYELSLVTVGNFDTVEGFARHLNNIRLPSQLTRNSNYHLFKNGIRPMWEDPANAKGGKWVVLFRSSPSLLDASWANLSMDLVGEILDPDDEVCGVVASTRPKVDRIQVWTRGRDDVDRINGIGRRILEAVCLEGRDVEAMSMEFQFNASNSTPPPNKYIHIPFPPSRSSFSHAPPTPSRLGPLNTGLSISSMPSPGADRLGVNGLLLIPLSPTSPTPYGVMLPPPPPIRRMNSGQGSNAFAGPMGGTGVGGPRGSLSAATPAGTR